MTSTAAYADDTRRMTSCTSRPPPWDRRSSPERKACGRTLRKRTGVGSSGPRLTWTRPLNNLPHDFYETGGRGTSAQWLLSAMTPMYPGEMLAPAPADSRRRSLPLCPAAPLSPDFGGVSAGHSSYQKRNAAGTLHAGPHHGTVIKLTRGAEGNESVSLAEGKLKLCRSRHLCPLSPTRPRLANNGPPPSAGGVTFQREAQERLGPIQERRIKACQRPRRTARCVVGAIPLPAGSAFQPPLTRTARQARGLATVGLWSPANPGRVCSRI
jgi:hypothetical protein